MIDAAASAELHAGTDCRVIPFPSRREARTAAATSATSHNADCPFAFHDAMRRVEAEVYGT